MSELPEFHDISWAFRNGEPQVKLLTDDGIQYEELPFRPYCYIDARDTDEVVWNEIRDIDETATIEKVEKRLGMADAVGEQELYKIEVAYPSLISKLRRALNDVGVETYEADIPYARRVMIDLDQTVEPPDEILAFDIEVVAEDGFPDPEKADKMILSIAAVGSDGEDYTFCNDDEKETIRGFIDVAEEYKSIIGWNSFKFDYPYLRNRTDRLDMDYDWFNVTHVDALPTYRWILLQYQQNFRLDTVAAAEFGDRFDYEQLEYDELTTYYEEDRDRLLHYNLEDARVVKALNERFRMKEITFDILASSGFCRPSDIFFKRKDQDYERVTKSSNLLIEGIVLNLSHKSDVVWPNKGAAREKFEGGKVFDPTPGLYDHAVTLDFASMYPSIISALNIGPETYRPNDSGDIDAPTGSFVEDPQSLFSQAYHVLKDQRDIYTQKKREATRESDEWYIAKSYDIGLKAYVNTFYGVIGSPYSRFYNHDVAENITKMGQAMLSRTGEFAEECGYEVIYGDTDSVILSLGDEINDPVSHSERLATLFTSEIKRFVSEAYNGDPEYIELTLDEVYSPFFITDAKKRYAGYCIYDGEPCFTFDMTGFESVRGDWPTASQDFQEDLLHAILRDEDPWDMIDDYRERLFNGELDADLIKYVGLRDAPSNYDSKPPHVRIAKEYEGTEHEFRVGDKVPYIKYGGDPKDVTACIDDEVPHITHSGYRYIWEKQFMSIVERFGIERHEKTELTDFMEGVGDD